MRGTEPMGSGSPAFPVHKETDGWERIGGGGAPENPGPVGSSSPVPVLGGHLPALHAHSRFPVQPFNGSSDC